MKKINRLEGKLLLFLVAAISVLCAGFIIIGCGSGSQSSLKVADPFGGATALDFTKCPVEGECTIAFASDSLKGASSIQGKPITMEAWVMPKGTSTATIFSRMGARGAALSVVYTPEGTSTPAAFNPAFSIKRVIEAATGNATSTVEYIVTSTTNIPLNDWSHVAGVLTTTNHSGYHNSIECVDQNGTTVLNSNQQAHLDIYVNGTITDCATTLGGMSAAGTMDNDLNNNCIGGDDDGGPCLDGGLNLIDDIGFAHNPADNKYSVSYNGVVDETRLWIADRTGKISTCKNVELGDNSSDCGRSGTGLVAYQRYNEGEGYTAQDFGKIGAGTKEYNAHDEVTYPPDGFAHWETGWVAGAPITPAD